MEGSFRHFGPKHCLWFPFQNFSYFWAVPATVLWFLSFKSKCFEIVLGYSYNKWISCTYVFTCQIILLRREIMNDFFNHYEWLPICSYKNRALLCVSYLQFNLFYDCFKFQVVVGSVTYLYIPIQHSYAICEKIVVFIWHFLCSTVIASCVPCW